MPIFDKILGFLDDNKKKGKSKLQNIIRDRNPLDKWDITDEIGDGAFGKVYKTCHKEQKTVAALKQVTVVSDEDLDDYGVEISILTECQHKNIIKLFETFLFDNKLWMFLEYCDGGAVDSIMLSLEKPLTEAQIKCITKGMCEGLQFLHSRFIIHRDLKAGNVLLLGDGQVKLADFGVSAKNTNMRQRRNSYIGTPYWMAPEVIHCETSKDEPYDYKADIWSLGITMIEFAQMDPPHHELNQARVGIRIYKSPPPTLDVPSNWSPEFNNFLALCLVKNPLQRSSASDLLNHPFIASVSDNRPLLELLAEAKAEVTEVKVVEEEPDDMNIYDTVSEEGGTMPIDTLRVGDDATAVSILEEIVSEVIFSNTKRPSIPSVILDAITEFVTGFDDVHVREVSVSGIGAMSDKEVELLSLDITDELITDVILSHNRHPSIPGVVLQVIMEMLKTGDSNDNDGNNNVAKKPAAAPVQPTPVVNNDKPQQPKRPALRKTPAEIQAHKGFRRTLTKTRMFVDASGQMVTSTTSTTVIVGEENKKLAEHEQRRVNMRELKLRQKREHAELIDLDMKSKAQIEQMTANYERERQAILKSTDVEIEKFVRASKQAIDSLAPAHELELKALYKKLKTDQDRERKNYQESMKQAIKVVKADVERFPKSERKSMLDARLAEHAQKEQAFNDKLKEEADRTVERFSELHKQKVALLERQLQEQKENALKNQSKALMDLDERQIKESYQYAVAFMKSRFVLQRHQMMARHDEELKQVELANNQLVSEMLQKHNAEKRRLPKVLRNETKSRTQMFKKSLTLTSGPMSEQELAAKLQQFETEEKQRTADMLTRMETKHERQLNELQSSNAALIKELEVSQEEKLASLRDQEEDKLEELKLKHEQELKVWKEKNMDSSRLSIMPGIVGWAPYSADYNGSGATADHEDFKQNNEFTPALSVFSTDTV